jgi:SAM-dependent methyltransferase
MTLNWIDVTHLSFNTLLLLEREQLVWLPGWLPETELATALKANPAVEWYLRNKNPDLNAWVDSVLLKSISNATADDIRRSEETVLRSMNDLVCYAVDPDLYENLPFLGWDSAELRDLVDFTGKTVVDIGSGTGRLAFIAAEDGALGVFAVEPVSNLRVFIKEKARKKGVNNIFTMDGLITDLPFPDDFIDIAMGGHVFGDDPKAEYEEMVRVVKPEGMVILCPGNNDRDDDKHSFLVDHGFQWSRFEEPGDGFKRKYWKFVV